MFGLLIYVQSIKKIRCLFKGTLSKYEILSDILHEQSAFESHIQNLDNSRMSELWIRKEITHQYHNMISKFIGANLG